MSQTDDCDAESSGTDRVSGGQTVERSRDRQVGRSVLDGGEKAEQPAK